MTFHNFNSANLFASNPKLSEIGLKADIPERYVQMLYVIKNIPTDITGLSIRESIEDNNPIDVI